jgi:hypothetical protein
MEKYEEAKAKAVKHMKVADHVLTMTYPLVQDPKLLKFVMTNMHTALENIVSMILYYERLYKRVPPFPENFDSMLTYLRPALKRYDISTGYIPYINEIRTVIRRQKESDIEFMRKDKFVFASKNYELSYITEAKIKDYLAKAKLFMQQILDVIKEEERITGKR